MVPKNREPGPPIRHTASGWNSQKSSGDLARKPEAALTNATLEFGDALPLKQRFSTRIGKNWLVLSHVKDSIWNLQIWGDTPLQAEISADNELEAKETSFQAAAEKLRAEHPSLEIPLQAVWNVVLKTRWTVR